MLEQIDTDTIEPIISCVCEERKGSITRGVWPMPLTIENLNLFWNKAKRFDVIFTDEVSQDFSKFLNLFLRESESGLVESTGLFWVVDDFVGVFYLTNIVGNTDALAHLIFFDSALNGRLELTKELIKYVFERYDFRRLSVQIPLYVKPPLIRFIKYLGFKVEGTKRKAIQYKDGWFDIINFGILREEVLDNGS